MIANQLHIKIHFLEFERILRLTNPLKTSIMKRFQWPTQTVGTHIQYEDFIK